MSCKVCDELEGMITSETYKEHLERMVMAQQRCVLVPVVIDESTDIIDVILDGADNG